MYKEVRYENPAKFYLIVLNLQALKYKGMEICKKIQEKGIILSMKTNTAIVGQTDYYVSVGDWGV